MKTLIIITIILAIVFVLYSETYIRIRTSLRLSSKCIILFFGGLIMISEIFHFIMIGILATKIFSKDYDLITPPKSTIIITDYDRKSSEIFYTLNGQDYSGEINSDVIIVDYGNNDYSTATFYDAEYKVWIYSVDTTVCKIDLSKAELEAVVK